MEHIILFTIIADNYIIVYTDGEMDFFQRTWTLTSDYILFAVRACEEAHIALTNVPGDEYQLAYFIKLGIEGNTKSQIIKRAISEEDIIFNTPDILSCETMNTLWIEWGQKYVLKERNHYV